MTNSFANVDKNFHRKLLLNYPILLFIIAEKGLKKSGNRILLCK